MKVRVHDTLDECPRVLDFTRIEGRRARELVAALVVALGAQHLRPEGVADGGGVVVGAEAYRVAENVHRDVATRDEPLAERGGPGDGFGGAEAGEERVGVGGELRAGNGGAQREVGHAAWPRATRATTGSSATSRDEPA